MCERLRWHRGRERALPMARRTSGQDRDDVGPGERNRLERQQAGVRGWSDVRGERDREHAARHGRRPAGGARRRRGSQRAGALRLRAVDPQLARRPRVRHPQRHRRTVRQGRYTVRRIIIIIIIIKTICNAHIVNG